MEQRVEQPGTSGLTACPLWSNQVDREIEGLSRPESVGLIAGERADGLAVLEELGRVLGVAPVSITEVGLSRMPIQTWQDLLERLDGHPLLFDLEALCWAPWLGLDVLRFLRLHAPRPRGGCALARAGHRPGRHVFSTQPERSPAPRTGRT